MSVAKVFPSRVFNLFQRPYIRNYGNTNNPTFCECGAKLPEAGRMVALFKARNIGEAVNGVYCPKLRNFDFKRQTDCKLADSLRQIATLTLREFHDVIHVGQDHFVVLQALEKIPPEDLGNLSGDHGKQLIKFLKDCLERGLFRNIGSLFDVGGQNTSTVDLISKVLNDKQLQSLIIDINSLTPAITKENPNIKYAIDDAFSFFLSKNYSDLVMQIYNDLPALFIFNNLLNVLPAEKGWETLEMCWQRLRPGDYLVISGLVPEQLGKHNLQETHELDGIIEFSSEEGFYKSALSSSFFKFVEQRLKGATVLFEETFEFTIMTRPPTQLDVSGRRLLTLKKV
jgi:hypothetical protein